MFKFLKQLRELIQVVHTQQRTMGVILTRVNTLEGEIAVLRHRNDEVKRKLTNAFSKIPDQVESLIISKYYSATTHRINNVRDDLQAKITRTNEQYYKLTKEINKGVEYAQRLLDEGK